MTLRIMLVSLVASLGLELPSDHDLACWSRSGREWVAARLADFSGPGLEADQPAAEVAAEPDATPVIAEVVKADDDRTFEVASEAMAADFAADLLAIQVENPGPNEHPGAPGSRSWPRSDSLPEKKNSRARRRRPKRSSPPSRTIPTMTRRSRRKTRTPRRPIGSPRPFA